MQASRQAAFFEPFFELSNDEARLDIST